MSSVSSPEFCESCGIAISRNANFCSRCGRRIRNYLETSDLTDSVSVQDAREGGQNGPNKAEGEGAADDLAVPG